MYKLGKYEVDIEIYGLSHKLSYAYFYFPLFYLQGLYELIT